MGWIEDLQSWFDRPPAIGPLGSGAIRLIRLHNAARDPAHPLRIEARLTATAAQWALVMAAREVLAHGNLADRAAHFGYQWSALGENIAAGQATPKAAFDAWFSDPPHRQNILNPRFTEVGFASAVDGRGMRYWVANYGTPLDTSS
jgi:uncharacterized protein YkwD